MTKQQTITIGNTVINFHDTCEMTITARERLSFLENVLAYFKEISTKEFRKVYNREGAHYFTSKGTPVSYPTKNAFPGVKTKSQVYQVLKDEMDLQKENLITLRKLQQQLL